MTRVKVKLKNALAVVQFVFEKLV